MVRITLNGVYISSQGIMSVEKESLSGLVHSYPYEIVVLILKIISVME